MDRQLPPVGHQQLIELDAYFALRREIRVHCREGSRPGRDVIYLRDLACDFRAYRNQQLVERIDRFCGLAPDRLADPTNPYFLV